MNQNRDFRCDTEDCQFWTDEDGCTRLHAITIQEHFCVDYELRFTNHATKTTAPSIAPADETSALDPMDIIQEILLHPQELVDLIANVAIENHARKAYVLTCPEMFEMAIDAIAKLWDLSEGNAEIAILRIKTTCAELDNDCGGYYPVPRPNRLKMLAIFATLSETVVLLNWYSERRAVGNFTYFLKEYWSLADELE